MRRTEPFREGDWNVSRFNYDAAVRPDATLPSEVEVFDLTLREGRQVAGVALSIEEVVGFAERAASAGIRTLEMHHSESEEIKRVKELDNAIRVQSLVHPTASLNPDQCRQEIRESLEVGADIVCLSAVVSEFNFALIEELGDVRMTREEAIDSICESVQVGKEQGAVMSVLLADYTRLDLDSLTKFTGQIAESGADIVRLDDICAPCVPAVYEYLAAEVKRSIGSTKLAIHTHDDFGLALAGQLASLEGGAEILEGSVNGLGERAGIPDLATLVATLELMYGYDTGIELRMMQELSDYVAETWGQPVPDKHPTVGRCAFSHSVGVHYVEPPWAFNTWFPHVVGNTSYVPLSMFSGPKAIRKKARDLGIGDLNEEQSAAINNLVRDRLAKVRRELSDKEFSTIALDFIGRQGPTT